MFNKLRPLIFKFSPEVAHSLAIKALKFNYKSKPITPFYSKIITIKLATKYYNFDNQIIIIEL